MRGTLLVLGSAALLGLASIGETLPAQGQEPIQSRTVLEGRIDRLPEGPACWDIRRGNLAPGARQPAAGFHAHGLLVGYVTGGTEQLTYDPGVRAGPVTLTTGQAALIADKMPHAHQSTGEVPRTNVNFEFSCERLGGSLGNSGPLPGMRPGVAFQVQLRERTWPPGSQTPVHVLSGPTTTFLLEGSIARSTEAGIAQSGRGDVYVSPVGVLAQNTNIGSTPARTLDLDVWPAGETRSVAQPQEVRLPSPFVSALPRTGEGGLATEENGASVIDMFWILAALFLVGTAATVSRHFGD